MTHELKTWPPYFNAIVSERKTFELRKADRDFRVDDTLHLREYSPEGGYTGRECNVEVSYIMHGPVFGIAKGFCIMGVKLEETEARIISDLDELIYLFSLSSKKPVEWITARSRKKDVVAFRHAMIYYIEKYSRKGSVEIGRFLGYDHTTILYALDMVRHHIKHDADYKKWIEGINPMLIVS